MEKGSSGRKDNRKVWFGCLAGVCAVTLLLAAILCFAGPLPGMGNGSRGPEAGMNGMGTRTDEMQGRDVYKRQLKSNHGSPDSCLRFTYAYENPSAGEGRFIHTYMHDGNPLPSFEGEPKLVGISGTIDEFTDMIWNSLNEDNKVSLFVRFIDIASGTYESRIVNKNK